MSDNKDTLIRQLHILGLSPDEATIYLTLLQEPSTHLRLSRDTGIARTKVYRLVGQLQKKGLTLHRTDDRGTFLTAAEPSNLERRVMQHETETKRQRAILAQLLPALNKLEGHHDNSFIIRTYEGEEGFKQMCWHELKTKGELVALGGGYIEELIPNHRWAEKHRQLSVVAGYKVRELINSNDMPTFTQNQEYMKNQYSCRSLLPTIIAFDDQTVIYNNTVAIYHHRHEKKLGIEIVSKNYADMMRTIFERYWQLATPISHPV